jgi:hypothetical protein
VRPRAALATLAGACAALSFAAAAQALTNSVVSSANTGGNASVTCPPLSRASSGGFGGDLGGLVTGSLAPASSLRGWSVLVDGTRSPSSGTTYAVCALGDVTLSVSTATLGFGYIPSFISAATATCANPLARVVGGGFQSTSASNANPTTASYPSGPRSWTVRVEAASLRDIPQGYAYAYCSLLALGAEIRQGSGQVRCGTNLQVFGGGWSGGAAAVSYPSDRRSWLSAVPAALPGEVATTYAICGF